MTTATSPADEPTGDRDRQRSLSFGAEAAAYERGRPSYPPEAIDWLLPADARDVLDLGAGTGKLTTRLVERGLDVVAVDPIPEMLEVLQQLAARHARAAGHGRRDPVARQQRRRGAGRAGLALVRSGRGPIAEVARVLRPGGRLGLVWNTRDERSGWVRDLGRIIGHEDDPFNHAGAHAGAVHRRSNATRWNGRII